MDLSIQLDIAPCLVGWSDFALFLIIENLHVSADQVSFNEFKKSKNPKNQQFWPRPRIARAVKFSFSKNHRGVKN